MSKRSRYKIELVSTWLLALFFCCSFQSALAQDERTIRTHNAEDLIKEGEQRLRRYRELADRQMQKQQEQFDAQGWGEKVGKDLAQSREERAKEDQKRFQEKEDAVQLMLWSIIIGLFFIYPIPLYIAYRRKCKHRVGIAIVNIVLGATGIIWIACLLWAIYGEKEVLIAHRSILLKASSKDAFSYLEDLGQMYAKGLLTEDEFKKEKRKILEG